MSPTRSLPPEIRSPTLIRSFDVDSASPAEVGLIESLRDQAVTEYPSQAARRQSRSDSDALRESLAARHIDPICPHRKGARPAAQDGRPLRRYRKHWIIERTISWFQPVRKLVTRCEFYAFLFAATPNLLVL